MNIEKELQCQVHVPQHIIRTLYCEFTAPGQVSSHHRVSPHPPATTTVLSAFVWFFPISFFLVFCSIPPPLSPQPALTADSLLSVYNVFKCWT